jgi:hypothetical protein
MTRAASRPKTNAKAAADRPRRVRPVMFFALLGGLFLTLGVYEWLASLFSGDLKPTTAGRGTGPEWVLWSVHGQEVLLGLLGLVVLVVVVVIPWRKTGHLTFDGMMVLSWATLWAIQDPWVSYSQTVISYNSTAFNLGCPQCHVPGWLSNNTLAEPIIWGLGCYLGPMYLFTLVACRLMTKARQRWPQIGPFGLIMVAIGFMAVSDVILEVLWTWTSVYSYGGADPRMSLFGQSYFKYPLWVGLFWGVAWGLIASIRYFTNDKGQTVVERGLNDVKASDKAKQALRLLAVIGAMNGLFAFAYNVPVQWFSLHAHAFPDDLLNRPYLLGGVCGPGTDYACPDPRVPIPRGAESGRVNPDGNFYAPNGLPDQTADDN